MGPAPKPNKKKDDAKPKKKVVDKKLKVCPGPCWGGGGFGGGGGVGVRDCEGREGVALLGPST
jgi:hypothetical protein